MSEFGIPSNFQQNLDKGLDKLEIKEGKTQDQEPLFKTADPKSEPDPQPDVNQNNEPLFKKAEKKEETPIELTKEQVLEYLNRDRENPFQTYEDVFKPIEVEKINEVIKEVDPWADVLDASDTAYLNFKKDTKRGYKEWEFVNQDFDKKDPLQLSIDKVRQDTGLEISNEDAKSYLENELGIDLSGESLEMHDKIKLTAFSKPFKESMKELQSKYKQPRENPLAAPQQPGVEMVTLDNGEKMPKQKYEELIAQRNQYIESVTNAVNSVTAEKFNISIDDNGEKRTLEIEYDYSNEDKQGMLSSASDVDAFIASKYRTKDGFNHLGLSKNIWRGEEKNFQKVMTAVAQKVRAETIKEMLAEANNENFSRKPLPKSNEVKTGYGKLPGDGNVNTGFGVQYGGFPK